MAQAEKRDICFVLMPFGGSFDRFYEKVYKPGIEEAGLDPIRVDDLNTSSAIIKDIWSLTNESKIMLADLTGKNPNVMYELGLAHGIPKPVIIIAESIDEVPFDLQHQRVITYDKDDPEYGQKLQEKITKAINDTLDAPESAIVPIFLEVKPDTERITVSEHQKELLEIKTDLEQIKRSLSSESSEPEERIKPELTHPYGSITVNDEGQISMHYSKNMPAVAGPGKRYITEGGGIATISEDDFERLISRVIEPNIKKGRGLSSMVIHLSDMNIPTAMANDAVKNYKKKKFGRKSNKKEREHGDKT